MDFYKSQIFIYREMFSVGLFSRYHRLIDEVYFKTKKPIKKNDRLSTEGRTRTGTSLRIHDFESCASTNSATPANNKFYLNKMEIIFNPDSI